MISPIGAATEEGIKTFLTFINLIFYATKGKFASCQNILDHFRQKSGGF
jgi:hypothetical protein